MNEMVLHKTKNYLLYCSSLTKSSLGRKGFVCLTGCCPSLTEVKARTQGGRLEEGTTQILPRKDSCWLDPHALLSYLSDTTQDHLPKDCAS